MSPRRQTRRSAGFSAGNPVASAMLIRLRGKGMRRGRASGRRRPPSRRSLSNFIKSPTTARRAGHRAGRIGAGGRLRVPPGCVRSAVEAARPRRRRQAGSSTYGPVGQVVASLRNDQPLGAARCGASSARRKATRSREGSRRQLSASLTAPARRLNRSGPCRTDEPRGCGRMTGRADAAFGCWDAGQDLLDMGPAPRPARPAARAAGLSTAHSHEPAGQGAGSGSEPATTTGRSARRRRPGHRRFQPASRSSGP